MKAFWKAGIDTSDIEGADEKDLPLLLATKFSTAKRTLSKDLWTTLAAESSDISKDILRLGVNFSPEQLKEMFGKSGITMYNPQMINQAQDAALGIYNADAWNRRAGVGRSVDDLKDSNSAFGRGIERATGGARLGWRRVFAGLEGRESSYAEDSDDNNPGREKYTPSYENAIKNFFEKMAPTPRYRSSGGEGQNGSWAVPDTSQEFDFGPASRFFPILNGFDSLDRVTEKIDNKVSSNGEPTSGAPIGSANVVFNIYGATDANGVAEICRQELCRVVASTQQRIMDSSVYG